jgi:hypothetical protein
VVEPLGDVLAVEPLRCRCQPEKLLRLETVEQPVIRLGSRVVKLVHDDHVERIGSDLL